VSRHQYSRATAAKMSNGVSHSRPGPTSNSLSSIGVSVRPCESTEHTTICIPETGLDAAGPVKPAGEGRSCPSTAAAVPLDLLHSAASIADALWSVVAWASRGWTSSSVLPTSAESHHCDGAAWRARFRSVLCCIAPPPGGLLAAAAAAAAADSTRQRPESSSSSSSSGSTSSTSTSSSSGNSSSSSGVVAWSAQMQPPVPPSTCLQMARTSPSAPPLQRRPKPPGVAVNAAAAAAATAAPTAVATTAPIVANDDDLVIASVDALAAARRRHSAAGHDAPSTPQLQSWPPPPPPFCWTRPLLPPRLPADAGKKTLVLDLDETLVHSSFRPFPHADFTIPVEIDGRLVNIYVLKRPGVDQFLATAGRWFEVVVFTASLAKYANPLLDLMDTTGAVRWRLFREACVPFQVRAGVLSFLGLLCAAQLCSALVRPAFQLLLPTTAQIQPAPAAAATAQQQSSPHYQPTNPPPPRHALTPHPQGNYVKDLLCLGRHLASTVIVDNSPHAYVFQPDCAVAIPSFIDDMADRVSHPC
jgi:hypothetical protein